MKLIFFTDSHLKGINPISRVGDYYSDIMTKFDEILKIAKKYKVDTILHGGDLFDNATVSNNIVDELLDKIEQSKTTWYITWGNHDLYGHHLSTTNSGNSSLAHILRRSDRIKHITALKPIRDTIITGYDYYHDIEQDIATGLISIEQSDSFKIAIIHALVTEKPFLPQVMHIVAKNIKTNYDLCLLGHYHQPFDITIDKTRFLNIGCLGRTSIDESNIEPSIALIDTDTRKIDIIKLKNTKTQKEAFNIDKIEQAKHYESNIEEFIKALNSTKFQGLNLRGIVENIGREQQISKDIIKTIIDRIGEYENT